MLDPNIIDPEAIATLNELNPDDNGAFLREIIGIYIEDTPRRLQDLKSSLASGDVALFTRTAHTIKGSSEEHTSGTPVTWASPGPQVEPGVGGRRPFHAHGAHDQGQLGKRRRHRTRGRRRRLPSCP